MNKNNTFKPEDKFLIGVIVKFLADGEASGDVQAALREILEIAFAETDDLFIWHPELIETAFRLIVTGNTRDYAKGVKDSLKAVLRSDGFTWEEILGKYSDYPTEEIANDSRRNETASHRPLDLSEVCRDFLGTNDATAHLEPKKRKTAKSSKEINVKSLAKKISHILCHEDISEKIKIKLDDKFEEWAGETGVYVTAPEVIETTFSMIMFYLGNRKNGQAKAAMEFIDSIINDLSKEHREELKQFDSIDEAEQLARQISAIMQNPLLPEKLRSVIAGEMNDASTAELFTPENVLHNLEILQNRGE